HASDSADARRDAELAGRGFRVVRFWNNEVLTNLGGVVETIREALSGTRPPPPPPPPAGGGGGALAGGALRGHRLRTALSVTGVAVGTAAVVALTALGEGARQYVVDQFAALGS